MPALRGRLGDLRGVCLGVAAAICWWGMAVAAVAVAQQQDEGRPDVRAKPQKAPGGELAGSGQESGQAVDWARLPVWRRAEFFGVRAQGRRFVFVVDCSGSMGHEGRLARAKQELRRTIREMRDPQHFLVIFFNEEAWTGPAGGLEMSCDVVSKDRLYAWMRTIEPDGETEPRGALKLALGQRPDGVFLVTDGEFAAGTAEAIAAMNRGRVPIHCIDLSGGVGAGTLQRIARESGGSYAARSGVSGN